MARVEYMNKIRLVKGYTMIDKRKFKYFEKGSLILADNPDVEEIKSWDIEQKEEAVAELSKLRCKYLELAEIYKITEYALEYFVADEDGEFISGSDFDFAEEDK